MQNPCDNCLNLQERMYAARAECQAANAEANKMVIEVNSLKRRLANETNRADKAEAKLADITARIAGLLKEHPGIDFEFRASTKEDLDAVRKNLKRAVASTEETRNRLMAPVDYVAFHGIDTADNSGQ